MPVCASHISKLHAWQESCGEIKFTGKENLLLKNFGLGTGQKVQGGAVGWSMRKSEGPKTHDPPPFMGIKSADPPPGSG